MLVALADEAALGTGQVIRVHLERRGGHLGLGPQIGSLESAGVTDGVEGRTDKVSEGLCLATGLGVDVLDTSQF